MDGIYPELARFVKIISVPIGQMQQWFSLWQEAARKDVECAFRIFQLKFKLVKVPLQGLDLVAIRDSVMACVILHNMMVEERVMHDEREDTSFYEIGWNSDDETDIEDAEVVMIDGKVAVVDSAVDMVLCEEYAVRNVPNDDMLMSKTLRAQQLRIEPLPLKLRVAQEHWKRLVNKDKHFCL